MTDSELPLAADARTVPLGASPFAAPPPAVVPPAAEGAEGAPPKQPWPIGLFVLLHNLGAIGSLLLAVAFVFQLAFGDGEFAELLRPLAIAAGGAALGFTQASMIGRRTKWGWMAAMTEIGLSAAAAVASIFTEHLGLWEVVFVLAAPVFFGTAFWRARKEFDVED